ncbi:MAG: hypothetical protein EXS08_06605 [Planctomycetes bacterium]|nr:hypothetical protein [Planctomycetota bacterium]
MRARSRRGPPSACRARAARAPPTPGRARARRPGRRPEGRWRGRRRRAGTAGRTAQTRGLLERVAGKTRRS